jgi:hypothetical protein
VREVYHVITHDHREIELGCLLALTGPGPDKAIPCKNPSEKPIPFALPASWKIEWPHFFATPESSTLNRVRKLDLGIAKALHDLRIEDVNKFNVAVPTESQNLVSPKNVLPVRTLWRGARMGLPCGQDVATALGVTSPLTPDEIKKDLNQETQQILCDYGFDRETPLWYYILKEAALRGVGEKLGPVGGRVVADVILAALTADPNSYVSIDLKWKPTIMGIPRGTMGNILHFVKRRESAEPCVSTRAGSNT